MKYRRPFNCTVCLKQRWPGDCDHFPVEGTPNALVMADRCQRCKRSPASCICWDEAKRKRELARKVAAAGLDGAWLPHGPVVSQCWDTQVDLGNGANPRLSTDEQWVLWSWMAFRASRFLLENEGWNALVRKKTPVPFDFAKFALNQDGADVYSVGKFNQNRSYNCHKVEAFRTSIKGLPGPFFFQRCILKVFDGLKPTLIMTMQNKPVMTMRNQFGAVLGIIAGAELDVDELVSTTDD